MPVIAFANSKGGSGKTTSALLLACELAEKAAVTIIDADPRHPVTKWAAPKPEKTAPPEKLTVVQNNSENTIIEEIEAAAARDPFVIIDLEGVASKKNAYAISQADLVIVPMKEQQQDAEAALDIIKELVNISKMTGKKNPVFNPVHTVQAGGQITHCAIYRLAIQRQSGIGLLRSRTS